MFHQNLRSAVWYHRLAHTLALITLLIPLVLSTHIVRGQTSDRVGVYGVNYPRDQKSVYPDKVVSQSGVFGIGTLHAFQVELRIGDGQPVESGITYPIIDGIFFMDVANEEALDPNVNYCVYKRRSFQGTKISGWVGTLGYGNIRIEGNLTTEYGPLPALGSECPPPKLETNTLLQVYNLAFDLDGSLILCNNPGKDNANEALQACLAEPVAVLKRSAPVVISPTTSLDSPEQVLAVIQSIDGDPQFLDAYFIGPDGKEIPATAGMQLRKEDQILTGYKTNMTISFVNSKGESYGTVELEELTGIQIGLFLLGDINKMELWLKAGGCQAAIMKQAVARTEFTVKSPTVTASVRGTIFRVHHDEVTQTSTVSVTEGEVLVTPVNKSLSPVTLYAGQQVQVTPSHMGQILTAEPSPAPVTNIWPSEPLMRGAIAAGIILLAIIAVVCLIGIGLWFSRSRTKGHSSEPLAGTRPYSADQVRSAHILPRSVPMLTLLRGNANPVSIDLSQGGVTLGRDPLNTVILFDTKASRQHARIGLQRTTWVLTDLHSSNGTFVNRVRVNQQELRSGDQIQIGQTVLIFSDRSK